MFYFKIYFDDNPFRLVMYFIELAIFILFEIEAMVGFVWINLFLKIKILQQYWWNEIKSLTVKRNVLLYIIEKENVNFWPHLFNFLYPKYGNKYRYCA